jgi:predicted RNase H-like HicB family nuclease
MKVVEVPRMLQDDGWRLHATGGTVAEAQIHEAIEFPLAGMREDGTPIPPPSSQIE